MRHGEVRLKGDESIWIHKMHGSFIPDESMSNKYSFAESIQDKDVGASVVITESDYDECYQEVGRLSAERSALMLALRNTCLIFGKSLDAQDLSFMYALRRARQTRREARQHAFMLYNDIPSQQEFLHLYNLDITPLVVNLPRSRDSGHYYFGTAAALARLFPDLSDLFDNEMENPIAEFSKLVCGPNVIAIGLASRNITGKTTYGKEHILPPAGRRNLRYSDIEEHVGGSAMTPLMILSALDEKDRKCRLSIVSAIGRQKDTYSAEILSDCKNLLIDADAVSCNQDSTWHSTVLVHTSYLKDSSPYPGQRIFLDRGYNKRVVLDAPEAAQLRAQLSQDDLRLVYLDKFLAAQHPPLTKDIPLSPEQLGPLLQPNNLLALSDALASRPAVDVVYETGGGGSPFQHVEKSLCGYINIFTSGFPFFASVVLYSLGWELPSSLKVFDPSSKWWEAEFDQETTAIEEMLRQLVDASSATCAGQRVKPLKLTSELLNETRKWAARTSGKNRRWFITTLHHLGALGIDLVNNAGWYCGAPQSTVQEIQNTSGAGDSFRAALMYSLLSQTGTHSDALARALWFSTDVATERCHHFAIKDACKRITEKYSGKYSDYENNPLP